MKSIFQNKLRNPGAAVALAVVGLLSAGAAQAAAVGTPSNTDITNTATLAYSVGGTPQTAIPSNSTSFKVDNKVNVLVVESGNAVTSVTPGATNQVTTFTVTNNGNTSQGYNLAAAVGTSAIIPAATGTAGTLTATNIRKFVDANNNGTYEPLIDTATAISTLASGDSVTVFVVADMPTSGGFGTGAAGDQAHVSLTAITTTTGTTTVLTATTGQDTAGVDIVFADALTAESGFVGASAAYDGQGTARDAYRIAAPNLTVSKAVTLICDPLNGSGVDRKNIPGAIVRYTITVTNPLSAPASATLATVVDALNANTTFDHNLVSGAGAPATATSCTSGGTPEGSAGSGFKLVQTDRSISSFLTNASGDADGASFAGSTVTINYVQALPAVAGTGGYSAGELKAGESVVVYFNAIIK